MEHHFLSQQYVYSYLIAFFCYLIAFLLKADDRIEAPRNDHTRKNSQGHYLLWDPAKSQSNPNISVTANITSTPISKQEHCLRFWYFDDSEMLYELDIMSKLVDGKIYRTIRPGIASNTWTMAQVDFFPYTYNKGMC